VEELPPTFTPLRVHWYDGVVPPLLGVAVNVTDVPEQMVELPATILTLGVNTGFTVMRMAFEVAVVVDAHKALLVNVTRILSPLANVFDE
jgi:hypothetical protein